MRIAVIGASGVLGRHVVPMLLERGHDVHALVRNPAAFPVPRHSRLSLWTADILIPESLDNGLSGCEAVLHLATAIPKGGTTPDWSANTAVRTAGTRNLLRVAASAGLRRYVQQSIAMIYKDAGAAWIDESAPMAPPNPVTGPVHEMEALVRASGLAWIILRGGVFYGPGTARMADWNSQAAAGTLSLPGDGSDYISLIHVEDMAAAAAVAAETEASALTVNVVDDEPVTYAQLFGFVADLHGAPPPRVGGARVFASMRVSNRLARDKLGWRPRYKSYRDGWTKSAAPGS